MQQKTQICETDQATVATDDVTIFKEENLTAFQMKLLIAVARASQGDVPSGPTIREELAAVHKEEIHNGQLYPNLGTLANKGLVVKKKLDNRTNTYQITHCGAKLLAAYRRWIPREGEIQTAGASA